MAARHTKRYFNEAPDGRASSASVPPLRGQPLVERLRLEVAGVRELDRLQRVGAEQHHIEIPTSTRLLLGRLVAILGSLIVRTELDDGRLVARCVARNKEVLDVVVWFSSRSCRGQCAYRGCPIGLHSP